MEKPANRPRRRKPMVGPAIYVTMSAEARHRLKALSDVRGSHAYELLEEAFWAYWQALPENREKRTAETIAATLDEWEAEKGEEAAEDAGPRRREEP